ncbi:MAG: cyclodeaminase/cyclohydrolase family protein [Oscillospiraceae bacterium]|nr:cyclodeaminase/cyclohydrolase family protein [Oscillospiraceae bacterium]MCL2278726.1 cyclodeaminase/cyclohydrolase family protein [Oscillospiraceae bacterium]
MALVNRTITDFSEVLASEAPAPGGGSTAALSGALGASLILMVTSLTIGKEKYAAHETLMREAAENVETMRQNLLSLIDRDTEAFDAVSAVFKMPKNTDEEKKERSAAMQAALKACTLTPFEVIECSLAVLEQAEKMCGKYNTNAASDLGVAALSLKTATEGAWLNMLINLDGIKDEEFVTTYRQNGEKLMSKATALADKIYHEIEKQLLPRS